MRMLAAIFITAAFPFIAHAEEVAILKKKAWATAGQSGYVVTYSHAGKIGTGAKVYCVSGGNPIYLVEGLDRGDGNKVGIAVGTDGAGGRLATDIAPGYMRWAIDIWRLTCN